MVGEVPEGDRNAIWNLFGGVLLKVASGASHYRSRTTEASTIMDRLFEYHRVEGVAMPYTMEDFQRDAEREILERLLPEERLRGLTPEERLRGLPPEERLQGLPAEERLRGLSVEDRLRGLSPEEIEEYLRRLGRPRDPESEH